MSPSLRQLDYVILMQLFHLSHSELTVCLPACLLTCLLLLLWSVLDGVFSSLHEVI